MLTVQVVTSMRRLVALSVACVVVVLALGGAGSAQARSVGALQVGTPTVDDASCVAAVLLVRDGFPRRALALVETASQPATAPPCASVVADAQAAAQVASLKAQAAAELAEGEEWDKVTEAAAAALELDRDNAAAAELQVQAQKAIAAGEADEAGATEKAKSSVEQLVDQWKVLLKKQLTPLGSLLLPLVGMLLLLVILARLVVLVVREWPEPESPPTGSRERDLFRPLILVGGVVSVAGASFVASVALSDTYSAPVSRPMVGWAVVVAFLASAPVVAAALQMKAQREAPPEAQREAQPEAPPQAPPEEPRKARAEDTMPRQPKVAGVVAVGVAAVGLALLGALVRGLEGTDVTREAELAWALGLAGLLAVQGVWLLAWWLATRIRLDVKASSEAEIGTLAALLSELGAEKPKGLEVPRGADVTALDGALAALPDNPVLKVLKDILRSISGVTPWTATIEGDAKARVVTVVRNGRTVGSAIIDPQRMRLVPSTDASGDGGSEAATTASSTTSSETDAPDHTLKMAAAFVLMTMAEAHPVIRRGLAGAVTWTSLGYHYVATTFPPGDAEAQRLLARALDEDPENRAARLAFRHAVDRESVDCDSLSRYATFLESFVADLNEKSSMFDIETLKLRATYTRAIIEVNAIYAHENGKHGADEGTCSFNLAAHRGAARAALESLDTLTRRAVHDPLRAFKSQFSDDVAGLRLLVGLDAGDPKPNSPTGMYNLGCTYASRGDVDWPLAAAAPAAQPSDRIPDDELARGWLDLACQDPRKKEWLTKDPQLEGFRKRVTYRTGYLADPRTDFFTLSTVKPLAKPLRSAGFGDVSLIAQANPVALGSLLPADPTVSAQLVELAQLRLGLGQFTPVRSQPDPAVVDPLELDPVVAQMVEWLNTRLDAVSPPSANDPSALAWVVDLVSQLGQDASPFPPAPPTGAADEEPATPLDAWAIEILDQLTSRGLARRASLVALAPGERTALAKKVVTALMKTHKPTSGPNLAAGEADFVTHLAAWMQRPS
jgi:hypothetical protein